MFDSAVADVAADPAVAGAPPADAATLAARLNAARGAQLAAELDGLDPADLDGAQLVDLMVAAERVTSWAAAIQLAAMGEFAHCRPSPVALGEPTGQPLRSERVSEFAGDEVALALTLSRAGADRRLDLALDLCERLTATMAALRAGDLDVSRARVISEGTANLSDDAARQVENHVLPRGAEQTFGQLRAAVARKALSVDPRSAQERHEKETQQRRVVVTPSIDGMAELWAWMSADEATAVMHALSALARSAKTPDDARGIDARRVDALVDLCVDAMAGGAGAHRDSRGAERPARPDDGAGRADRPDDDAGPAGAADGDAGPAARPDGYRCRPTTLLHVTAALGTLCGLDEEPGELAGFGPIPAEMVRRLAGDATWRRLLVDPVTGALLDVGSTSYAPPAALATHVRTRDGTCRFPGCRQPAGRCDLDHTVAFPAGRTAAGNLAALCRHHHRLKHHPGWRVVQDPDERGGLTWTSPTGHTYRTEPATTGHDRPNRC